MGYRALNKQMTLNCAGMEEVQRNKSETSHTSRCVGSTTCVQEMERDIQKKGKSQ